MPQLPQEYQILSPEVGELLDTLYGFGNEHYQGAIANAGTITTQVAPTASTPGYYGTVMVTPAGNVTGIIFQPGLYERQELMVLNNSAYTITPDVVGTSNVLSGSAVAILANTAPAFV